jgi:hypothetical protein
MQVVDMDLLCLSLGLLYINPILRVSKKLELYMKSLELFSIPLSPSQHLKKKKEITKQESQNGTIVVEHW